MSNISWKIPKNNIGEKIIPKMPELKEYVGKPYSEYVDAMKVYEKTMSEFEVPENTITNKNRGSILKTFIIALSIIISSCVIGYAYYESNRYWVMGSCVIDKYNATFIVLQKQ
ncbi:MAG: hypothetical protein P4L34_13490 [Paludibacter sp.]|nr:hypothetical protein [Paludibacter sp.]